jgi:cytosine/adenosine deaminase-related metal-dependent hydrolase
MAEKGIKLTIGMDGNPVDLLSSANLMAGLLRDCREDETLFPATEMLEMLTRNGARSMGLEKKLGAVEVGRYADVVLYENRMTHWSPDFDIADQVINAGGGAQAHSVWVHGQRVIENYRSSRIDEEAVYGQLQEAGARIVSRSGVPVYQPWPVL